jgi:hypothetical protein
VEWLEILHHPLYQGETLYGLSSREHSAVFLKCEVQKRGLGESDMHQTNSGGTHSLRVIGYVDWERYFRAIHYGQRFFLNLDWMEDYSEYDNVFKLIEDVFH